MNELWKSICCCSTLKYFAFLYHFVNVTCLFSLSSHWFWSEKFIVRQVFLALNKLFWTITTCIIQFCWSNCFNFSFLHFLARSLYHWSEYKCRKLLLQGPSITAVWHVTYEWWNEEVWSEKRDFLVEVCCWNLNVISLITVLFYSIIMLNKLNFIAQLQCSILEWQKFRL